MALTLRTLTNRGEPLCDQSGRVLTDTKITFTLIDKFGNPRDVFDATTGERVASITQTVTTDREGMFSIDLFPTSRADSKVYYLCKVDNAGVSDIFAPLVEGEDAIAWSTFKQAAGNIDPKEISAFALHVSDNARHLTPEQNDAMEAASSPSKVNPFATLTDIIVAGGGHGIQDDGLNLTQQPNINFTGDGVTVTSDSETGAIIVAISGADAGDASNNLKGISKLSVAPVDPTNPIAVGTNDPRMSDARTPLSHSHILGLITDVTISAVNLNSLDDGTDSSLHFHMVDRNRANHTGTQGWATVSKLGSKLTDMADMPAPIAGKAFKRKDDDTGYEWADISGLTNHENLAGLQGGRAGEHYHLTIAQATSLTGGTASTDHYHTSDRNRANHSGTQTANSISDFQTTVSSNTDVMASVTHKNDIAVHVSSTEKAALIGTGNLPSSINKFVTQDTLTSSLLLKVDSSALGSAAYKSVPVSGNAAATQVVLGNDLRLSDSRNPLAHYHSAVDLTLGILDGDRLPPMTAGKQGAVPPTGAPSGKFLRDDGVWSVVNTSPGGGGGSYIAGAIVVIRSDTEPTQETINNIVLQGVNESDIFWVNTAT